MNPPPRPTSRSRSLSNSPSNDENETPPQPTLKQRAGIKTHHCRFCSHLLLATTQDLETLPRRREPGADRAVILPLPEGGGAGGDDEDEDEDGESGSEDEDDDGDEDGDGAGSAPEQKKKADEKQPEESSLSDPQKRLKLLRKHYTILLSTTLPDRKHTVIRREDGFEKRLLLRCGRCRVVVGYVLDEEAHGTKSKKEGDANADADEEERAKVVYILPGSLVGTEEMGSEVKVEKEEWAKWIKS